MNAIRLALPLLVVMFAALACGGDNNGGGGGGGEGTVNVMGLWGGEELDSFNAMVQPWGGTVEFTGTRELTSLLSQRVEGGSPPDVAIPAEVGLFQQFANEGKLTPLSRCPGLENTIRQNYPQSFIDLGTVNGQLYGFFMKADSKATIWYDPSFFREKGLQPLGENNNFQDLINLSNQIKNTAGVPPWSMGQDAGAGSIGFPGSDIIQQIIINDSGLDTYNGIISGSIPYNSPPVRDAWMKFGQLALTPGFTAQEAQGGGAGINATNYQDSSYLPFQDPPRAAMVPLGGFTAGFIKNQFPNLKPGDDYNFFTWPGGAVTGGANIVYAFNSNPATCSFLNYLAGADAQEIWVKRGGFTSVNKQVSGDAYSDQVARELAQQLTGAQEFQLDMDDAMGGTAQQAIFRGVAQYLTNPGSLDQILAQIQASR